MSFSRRVIIDGRSVTVCKVNIVPLVTKEGASTGRYRVQRMSNTGGNGIWLHEESDVDRATVKDLVESFSRFDIWVTTHGLTVN